MKVKSLNYASDKECTTCGSWAKHWEAKKHQKFPSICIAQGCTSHNPICGHVKKADSTEDIHFIAPICQACNIKSSADLFEVGDDWLVKAEVCSRI